MHKKVPSFLALLVFSCVSTYAQEKDHSLQAKRDLALIKSLCETASNSRDPLLARTIAIDALGKLALKDPKMREQQRSMLQSFINDASLEKLKNDDDAVFFMIHVVQALGHMGTDARDALPDLARARGYEANLNSAVEAAVHAILVPVPSPLMAAEGIKELLADLTNRRNVFARLAAAKALGQFVDPRVLAALSTAAATDPDRDVQIVAAEALRRVTTIMQQDRQQYVLSLVSLLDKSNDVTVRMMAAKTLGSLGKDALVAVPQLSTAAADPDPDLQTVAANALKRIQPKK